MIVAALILFFVGIVLLVIQLFPAPTRVSGEEEQLPGILRTFRPLIKYLAGFNRKLPLTGLRSQYARRIERAGLAFDLNPDDFLAIKEIVLLGMVGFSFLVYYVLIRDLTVFAVGILIGYLLPDMRLSDAAKKREQACLRALPTFLDLLTLSVEAGLGFDAAVRKLTERLEPGPLIAEFKAFLRNMSVGKPRNEALRDMAKKLDLPDFTSFANAVVQATEAGASIGPVLRMQSGEIRTRRFQRAEKLAHEAPIKMLFPLFAFIFPATFLMIFGPLFFQVRASGGLELFGFH